MKSKPLLDIIPQAILLAASLACCTAGNSKPTNTPIIAMTTSSSISVNALRLVVFMLVLVLVQVKAKGMGGKKFPIHPSLVNVTSVEWEQQGF